MVMSAWRNLKHRLAATLPVRSLSALWLCMSSLPAIRPAFLSLVGSRGSRSIQPELHRPLFLSARDCFASLFGSDLDRHAELWQLARSNESPQPTTGRCTKRVEG